MPRVLMWVPLPPPFAGPEIASRALVEACRPLLDVVVESATVRTSNATKGRFDLDGIIAFGRAYRRFLRALRGVEVVYLVVAGNVVGGLRDAVLIATARAAGKRIVLHFRGGRYDELASPAWRFATRSIVQSERLRAQVPRRTDVIPNGLDECEHPAKARYSREHPALLFVGHVAKSKGFHDLVDAARGAELHVAGEILDDDLRSLLASPGVTYHGVVTGEAKRALFDRCDVFVLPSYGEGFSLAMLEAMFHGLAVITTNVGAAPDVIASSNGILVEPGDRGALADAIAALRDDPDRRIAIGRHNAREARERYRLEDVARRLCSVIEEAARPELEREQHPQR
ncbi:MAG: glycosyltransferase family 4 protein [Kofleriaceae bacterium]